MIVRVDTSDRVLITQPDHAALAGRIMAAWRADGWPASPRRAVVATAIAEHDNGWCDVDRSPVVDAEGQVLDFVTAPDDVRRRVWPRGVAQLAAEPYAAALVAEHALRVYDRYRPRADWQAFFAEMTRLRDRALADSPTALQPHLDDDYFFVRMGDLLSLAFCNGWTEPQKQRAYTAQLTGSGLIVAPDPFEGAEVPFTVKARRLPNRRYNSAEEARDAFESAPVVELAGVAAGR